MMLKRKISLILLVSVGFAFSYAESECEGYSLDCMLLIDGSKSFSTEDFRELIELSQQVVSDFDLTENNFGVIQYSHYYKGIPLAKQPFLKTEISLGEYKDHENFNKALKAISHHGYTTYTAKAIKKSVKIDFKNSKNYNNPCVKKAMVVITDGEASDDELIAAEVDVAMREGINMIAVGPKWSNFDGLKKIVYGSSITESNDKVYMATETEPLKSLVDDVTKDIRNLINFKTLL